MNKFWKSPRPEIPESDLFSYDEGEVHIVPDAEFASNLTTGTLRKGLPVFEKSEDQEVVIKADYNQDQVTAIVKAWLNQ